MTRWITLPLATGLCTLVVACATSPAPVQATAAKDCEKALACEVSGLLEMSSDGHGYIGIVKLTDGSCINVSLPEGRSKALMGQPAQQVSLSGRVVFFPYEPGALDFKVNGRAVGYGRCASYFVFLD